MYRVGDQVTYPVRFVVDGSLVDPTEVTAKVEFPDASLQTLSVTRLEQGLYAVVFVPSVEGQHVLMCTGVGPGAKTHSDVVNVAPARAAALASLADLKAHLNMDSDSDDEELRSYLDAATEVVEQHVGQAVARRSITERHHVPLGGRLLLNRHPVLSITSLASTDGGVEWTPDLLEVNRATGDVRAEGASLVGDLSVTYVAGYAAVPPNMSLAALIIAAHLWETQRSSSVITRSGDDSYAPMPAGFAIPNRAVELLGGRPPRIA